MSFSHKFQDSISNEANAISRIKKEVKEYFQKDVEAMQEATAGGWWEYLIFLGYI